MIGLRRNLSSLEAVGLSISIIAPTVAMAFNVTLAAGAAGTAAPLAFIVGTVALAVVGLSFVFFSRRVADAGSAYAYVSNAFGPRAGFLAGWLLTLTYLLCGSGIAALMGDFVAAALGNYGIVIPGLWLMVALAALLVATAFAYRDMKVAARLMLAFETAAVLAIIALGVKVLLAVGARDGLPVSPFLPDPKFGWSGVAHGMVFAVLSFAGFEAATTLGEEMAEPRRSIPIAVLGTVLVAGVFFVFASYVQVVGFGLGNMAALAADSAPLNTLALKYGSREFATLLNVAAAVSAFSAALGAVSAGGRMLFALGRAGLAPALGVVHPIHGTPARAVLVMSGVMIAGLVLLAPLLGASDYFGDVATIGTLCVILVYLAVTLAVADLGRRARSVGLGLMGVAGTVAMFWPFRNSLYPVPPYPGNLWPYVVIGFIVVGLVILRLRPGLDLTRA